MRIILLSNPTSRHGRHSGAADAAVAALEDAGHEVLVATSTGYEATRRRAVALLTDMGHRPDALVVVGGDGMIHLGLGVVARTGVPLGVVAVGTGNDIARHFGLPVGDVGASVSIVNHALAGTGRVLAVDAIHAARPDGTPVQACHQWSMATVGAGIEAAVNARANTLPWPSGESRYTVAALEEIVRLDPCGRLSVLALLRRVFAGTHVGRPGVHLERSRSLTIEPWPDDGAGGWLRDPPHPYADGERLASLPLHLEAVPQAVGLLLPA